jgi:hypothetical protein
MNYRELEEIKTAFREHVPHLHLALTGAEALNVIVTTQGAHIAVVCPHSDPDPHPDLPRYTIWRLHALRTGTVQCEGTAAGVAQYLARPEAGLISQQ